MEMLAKVQKEPQPCAHTTGFSGTQGDLGQLLRTYRSVSTLVLLQDIRELMLYSRIFVKNTRGKIGPNVHP